MRSKERAAGFPTISELLPHLLELAAEAEPVRAVRLQVSNGDWQLHVGEACYDTDHHGYWGDGEIAPDMTDLEVSDLAQELLDEALDQFWSCSEEE